MTIHPSFRLLPVLAAATFFGGISAVHGQNVIVNGDFEATPGTDASTTTFPGWSEFQNSTTDTLQNGAVVHAGLGGSSTAARLPGDSLPGSLRQDVNGPAGFWIFEMDFAMADPGDTTGTVERGLNINLFHDKGIPTNNPNRNINLSVFDNDGNGFGEIRVVSGASTFNTVMTDVVPFSVDLNGNGILSDAGDDVKMVRLTITGTYDATPSYTIKVNFGASEFTSGDLTHWQNGAPIAGQTDNIDRVNFASSVGGTRSYIIDNVSLVPEPGSATMFILGAGMMGLVRRRS